MGSTGPGLSVSSAGDVNGDGFDDVIVGAPFADAAGNLKNAAGESYVIFGQAAGFADIDLATLTATQGLPHLRRRMQATSRAFRSPRPGT